MTLVSLRIYLSPFISLALMGAITPFACHQRTKPCQLRVLAASSLILPLEKIKLQFEQTAKVRICLDFASSGVLRRKIERSALGDVFLSASTRQAKILLNKGHIVELKPFAKNQLVLITSSEHPLSSDACTASQLITLLKQPKQKIAIGNPLHVPVGRYAKEALLRLGIWQDISHKLLLRHHARAALRSIELGLIPFGFVFASDAHSATNKVKVHCKVPSRLHTPILYMSGLLSTSKQSKLARTFTQFLRADKSRGILENHGFITRAMRTDKSASPPLIP